MIWDTFENADNYTAAWPQLQQAIDFAKQFDPTQPDGRYEIDGNNCFALVSSYQTEPAETRRYEGHQAHADVQILLDGQERLDVVPTTDLQEDAPYCKDNDIAFYASHQPPTSLSLQPGQFTLLLPNDIHKPNCSLDAPAQVRKMVIKIRLTNED